MRLQGNLEIKSSGKYQFNGRLKSYDDIYDFNKSPHRSFIGELLTFLGSKTKGTPFYIQIRGERKINERN